MSKLLVLCGVGGAGPYAST